MYTYLLSATFTAGGAWMAGGAFMTYLRRKDPASLCAGAVGVLIIGAGFYLLSRIGTYYKFEGGSVSAMSGSGKLQWRADLTALTDVRLRAGRYETWLTLRWPDHKRTVVLFDSLRKALSTHGGPA
jgi:hypothetical protein